MMRGKILFCAAIAGVWACGDDDAGDDDVAPTVDARASDAASRTPDAATPTPDAAAPTPDAATPDAGPAAAPTPFAYWSMDTADITAGSLNELIGDVDGTVNGAVADAAAMVAQGLAFDGTDDTIDFGDSLDGVFAGADRAFSVAVWLKPGVGTVARAVLGKTSDTACVPDEDGRQWLLTLRDDNTLQLAFQPLAAGSAQLITATVALDAPATWYHVALVYDGAIDTAPQDRVTLYVDGAAVGTTALSLGTFPFDLQDVPARMAAGARMDSVGAPCVESGSTFYLGSMDELAVWDRSLTADEVTRVRARGLAGLRLID